MRIISGFLKGRKFIPPASKWPTRPTTDFSREGLFNILQNRLDFEEIEALDLFGGAGSHSFEMISRGCNKVTYVDKHRPCLQFVAQTAEDWGITEKINIVFADVAGFIKSSTHKYHYIFAGPPYPLPWLDKIPDMIFEINLLKTEGLFVMEHNPNHDFSGHPRFAEMRTYGKTYFSFFE